MVKEINLYTDKIIEVTPFGVDINQFKPVNFISIFDKGDIVIGTVKSLEEVYGIEYLIKAFKIVSDRYPKMPLKLMIVGDGSLKKELEQLTENLNLEDKTVFTGKVPSVDIPKYQNMLSVSVSVSNSESFGVAIIEASACEKPVVVSDVGGLPEVVVDDITGIVVPSKNPQRTAEAIERLILDENLRENMGKSGRKRVEELYDWDDNVKQMINIYKDMLNA